jgi:hypothetical protein
MSPYGSLWILMGPYGSWWVLMDHDGSLWIMMGPYRSWWVLWIPMGPYGSWWVLMDPDGSLWILMGPYNWIELRVSLRQTGLQVLDRGGPSHAQAGAWCCVRIIYKKATLTVVVTQPGTNNAHNCCLTSNRHSKVWNNSVGKHMSEIL